MKKQRIPYPEKGALAVDEGDILIIERKTYVGSYTQQSWKQELSGKNDFRLIREAWKVEDVTNNGNVRAHDKHGETRYVHCLDHKPATHYIVAVIR